MIHIDPTTRQRVVYSKHCGDLIYDKSGDRSVSTEDVPNLAAGSDWGGNFGQAGVMGMFACSENQLQGTDADIESNAKLPNLTIRGNHQGTHRERVIKQYVGNPNSA